MNEEIAVVRLRTTSRSLHDDLLILCARIDYTP